MEYDSDDEFCVPGSKNFYLRGRLEHGTIVVRDARHPHATPASANTANTAEVSANSKSTLGLGKKRKTHANVKVKVTPEKKSTKKRGFGGHGVGESESQKKLMRSNRHADVTAEQQSCIQEVAEESEMAENVINLSRDFASQVHVETADRATETEQMSTSCEAFTDMSNGRPNCCEAIVMTDPVSQMTKTTTSCQTKGIDSRNRNIMVWASPIRSDKATSTSISAVPEFPAVVTRALHDDKSAQTDYTLAKNMDSIFYRSQPFRTQISSLSFTSGAETVSNIEMSEVTTTGSKTNDPSDLLRLDEGYASAATFRNQTQTIGMLDENMEEYRNLNNSELHKDYVSFPSNGNGSGTRTISLPGLNQMLEFWPQTHFLNKFTDLLRGYKIGHLRVEGKTIVKPAELSFMLRNIMYVVLEGSVVIKCPAVTETDVTDSALPPKRTFFLKKTAGSRGRMISVNQIPNHIVENRNNQTTVLLYVTYH